MTTVIDYALHRPDSVLYVAAATVVLSLLTELIAPGRRVAVLFITAAGAAATAFVAWFANRYAGQHPGHSRTAFCVPAQERKSVGCSYSFDHGASLLAMLFAVLTLAVLLMSANVVRRRQAPPGEYVFLLACSMFGGVVLAGSADLITLIVGLETLTLPLYVLVGLRRQHRESAEGAMTFFVVSVVATSVTLLGAALLYGLTGTVFFGGMAAALEQHPELRDTPLTSVAVLLILVGLAFKVAAVPFHAWAPSAYDGAPIPVAAYLSTASKLGGVVALLYVSTKALTPYLDVTGPALAILAAVTMTVGNLVALRQRRMVRLLAWSSIAQAGYLLAPLGAFAVAFGRRDDAFALAVATTIAYTIFYVLLEIGAFAGVVALRGEAEDGGDLSDYRGSARRSPWIAAAFILALAGLAGLPPGLAGLFAKAAVIRSLLVGHAGWLAVVVAINAVIGLAYYVRAARSLFGAPASLRDRPTRWPAFVLAAATVVALVVGFLPQVVFDATDLIVGR